MAELRFIPKHPEKYAGDAGRIFARSGWELAFMQRLDAAPGVTKWMSEPKNLNISYLSPINKKIRQYWPDFLVQYADNSVELIEIKPMKEAVNANSKTTYDKLMLIQNAAKWQAADRFARSIGARFRVLTEQQLFRVRPAVKPPMKTRTSVRTRPTRKLRNDAGRK
jgi:hypothetical protein